MSKHTPGPWISVHEVILYDAGDGEFPSLASCVGEPNAAANAKLIAAAPELLALAIRVAANFEGTDAPLGLDAVAVIAKVTS